MIDAARSAAGTRLVVDADTGGTVRSGPPPWTAAVDPPAARSRVRRAPPATRRRRRCCTPSTSRAKRKRMDRGLDLPAGRPQSAEVLRAQGTSDSRTGARRRRLALRQQPDEGLASACQTRPHGRGPGPQRLRDLLHREVREVVERDDLALRRRQSPDGVQDGVVVRGQLVVRQRAGREAGRQDPPGTRPTPPAAAGADRRGAQPALRVLKPAEGTRPLQRRQERLLHDVLGRGDVADEAGELADEPAVARGIQLLDGPYVVRHTAPSHVDPHSTTTPASTRGRTTGTSLSSGAQP